MTATELLQRAIPIALIATGLIVAGCSTSLFGTRGEGAVTTETREVPTFSRVEVSGGIGLTISNGTSGSVTVAAQPNIMSIITTTVDGDTLYIKPSSSYTTSAEVEVTLDAADLTGLTVSGGSRVDVANVKADTLDVQLSGGSVVTSGGSVGSLAVTLTGGSRADLTDLAAGDATVDVSGGSTALVQANDLVSGSASGQSRVEVRGDARVEIAATGGATVSSR